MYSKKSLNILSAFHHQCQDIFLRKSPANDLVNQASINHSSTFVCRRACSTCANERKEIKFSEKINRVSSPIQDSLRLVRMKVDRH